MGRPAHRGRCERACICLWASRGAACRRPLRGAHSSRALVRTQPPPCWIQRWLAVHGLAPGLAQGSWHKKRLRREAREERLLSWCSSVGVPRPCPPHSPTVGKVQLKGAEYSVSHYWPEVPELVMKRLPGSIAGLSAC